MRSSAVPQDQGFVFAIDAESTKILVPLSALRHTSGLDQSPQTPSLCRLFLSGRCRQGSRCHQIHADPDMVQACRLEARQKPACCHVHTGDCDFRGLPLGLTVVVDGTTVPLLSTVPTRGLRSLYALHGSMHVSVAYSSVCKQHIRGSMCRFGDECNFLHICKAQNEEIIARSQQRTWELHNHHHHFKQHYQSLHHQQQHCHLHHQHRHNHHQQQQQQQQQQQLMLQQHQDVNHVQIQQQHLQQQQSVAIRRPSASNSSISVGSSSDTPQFNDMFQYVTGTSNQPIGPSYASSPLAAQQTALNSNPTVLTLMPTMASSSQTNLDASNNNTNMSLSGHVVAYPNSHFTRTIGADTSLATPNSSDDVQKRSQQQQQQRRSPWGWNSSAMSGV